MGGGGANLLDSPKTEGNNNILQDTESTIIERQWKDFASQSFSGGTGTENNPYQISSAEELAFLSLKHTNYAGKHFVLTKDIILNDGYFEDDGTYHDGGDGFLCHWQSIRSGVYFDGCGFSIIGMYINEDTSHLGLFVGQITVYLVENLKFDNLFINSHTMNYASAIGGNTVNKVKNVEARGTIISNGYSSGVCLLPFSVINCINYVNLFTIKGHSAGVCFKATEEVEGCKNYGKITGSVAVSGIVVSAVNQHLKVSFCENFGELTITDYWGIGGIIVWATGKVSVLNCVNYGKLNFAKQTERSTGVGGIAGVVYGKVLIQRCFNYGKFTSAYRYMYYAGEIAGECGDWKNSVDTMIEIYDCKAKTNNGVSIVGQYSNYKSGDKFILANIDVEQYVYENERAYRNPAIIIGGALRAEKIIVRNISYKTNSPQNISLRFVRTLSSHAKTIVFENIFIETKCSGIRIIPTGQYNNKVEINGIVWKNIINETKNDVYYGTDFSGFYVDWKTGKIGLKAFSGKGFFQGEVTEEWLIAKGFVKKEF